MFIGHIPAGYLWTHFFLRWSNGRIAGSRPGRVNILSGLIASILPDFDLFYFYLIDHRQHLHHGYWTHIPAFWLCIMAVWIGIGWLTKHSRIIFSGAIIGSNIFLHLFLDTIVGDIRWLYPLSRQSFSFFHVPATFDWWVLSFILHWTFLFEVAIMGAAGYVFFCSRPSRT
ncbi:metal-dependent hydrolase [Desulfobacterales bacterium HSG2]|nr:metal-dependent hydrolase [Desulfobacterales bacterium HSG2]